MWKREAVIAAPQTLLLLQWVCLPSIDVSAVRIPSLNTFGVEVELELK